VPPPAARGLAGRRRDQPPGLPHFGFTAAAAAIRTLYPGPAFMGLDLTPGTLATVREVRYPAAFGEW
jgi:hypothetical protein